jgi:cytochrome P450
MSSADGVGAGGARPPSEIPRPGILHFLQTLASGGNRIDMLTPLRRIHVRHGDVVMQQAGPLRMVNLFGPDANRAVLLDQDRIFSAKRPWDAIMGRIFPGGLLLRDGEDHKHHRKLMHTAFTRPAIRSYALRMNPMIAARLPRWTEQGSEILAFPAFKELTLDMAASIFVGMDLGPGSRPMKRAFEDMVAASMSQIRLRIPGLEFYRGLVGREWLIGFFRDLIGKRRASEAPDMFARLCRAETEEGHRLDDQEIIDHMIFLMMAAHDTTTSTLTSMTYELARSPAWQDRLRDESRALGQEQPSFEDLEQLEGLGMVMKETLRRYPPLPVIPRVALEEFEFGGYRIPAGSMVVVAPIHTHHMEEWWEDPFLWEPERFASGRAEYERHTHAWVPFGGGPHHCLGFRFAETQVKLVMHQLLLGARWSVPSEYRMPVQQAPISKPRDGLPIRLERL